ncbi:hypothetical protein NYR54_02900 [Chelativorans sp. SCAU2101]|uniref:Uncharacterized protein n=1 Tax=Chelativorans petroleitrophicus TaxID=2975484 RepID=A0A9X2X7S8_9HYPH|nr:hypothetical protein [Chelativorans petroleitrophicus]MCT8989250.1 hypothetical protein [Chelativorans petroleitrophicus]
MIHTLSVSWHGPVRLLPRPRQGYTPPERTFARGAAKFTHKLIPETERSSKAGHFVDGELDLTSRLALGFAYDDFTDDDGQIWRNGKGSVSYEFDEHWKLSFGVSYTETDVAAGDCGVQVRL